MPNFRENGEYFCKNLAEKKPLAVLSHEKKSGFNYEQKILSEQQRRLLIAALHFFLDVIRYN